MLKGGGDFNAGGDVNGGGDCFVVADFFRFGVNAPWIPVRFAKDVRKRFTRDARCFSEDVGDVLFRGDGVNPNFLRRRSRSSFNFKSLARSSFVSFSIVV